MKALTIFFSLLVVCKLPVNAQAVNGNIRSIKLFGHGDQTAFPAIPLGFAETMELHFDDLDNRVRNYYYTFELCNADWTPSILHPFEYIKGFQNMKISTYRNSSIAFTRYIHYQATVPDRNCYPNRSGNYLLKVFLDNDPTKIVFTKRMVVIDNKAIVSSQILQPYNSDMFRIGQKVNVVVQTDQRVQVMSPNELKVVILQNNNWQTASLIDHPTIFRGNYYEFSDESINTLPAGKEFRWIDLRSLRLKSDRMQEIDNHHDTTVVYVKPDPSRNAQVYIYYRDINGSYTIETMENINPLWQGDYAEVHFSFFPVANKPFEGSDLYLFGEFTDYASDTSGRMIFNKERGAYEKTLFLKQGFYDYNYVTIPLDKPGFPDFSQTEGNYYATENSYTVLVYFRPFGARADELIGSARLNSAFQR